jgi:hypothetical protein
VSNLQQWFDQLVSFVSAVPKGVWFAAGALPIILAAFSARRVIILGSMLAIAVYFFVILEPHKILLIIAAAAYLASILVAVYGIQIKRMDYEMANLKRRLSSLEASYGRQLMVEITKAEPGKKEDNSEAS